MATLAKPEKSATTYAGKSSKHFVKIAYDSAVQRRKNGGKCRQGVEREREIRVKGREGCREKEGSRDGVSNVSAFARAASALQLNHQAEKWPQGGRQKVRDEERERRGGR